MQESSSRYVWLGKQREHRAVWEEANGPIPEGAVIHHIDGNPSNNALDNLMLCPDQRHHMRLQHGWRLVDGEWHKPCSRCGDVKPTSDFYRRRTGSAEFVSRCKACELAVLGRRVSHRACGKCGASYRPAFGGQRFCATCRG